MTSVVRKGLVLGFYEKDGTLELTPSALKFQQESGKEVLNLLHLSGLASGKVKAQTFFIDNTFNNVALTNLGAKGTSINVLEEVDEGKENVRTAVAAGVRLLNSAGVREVHVDPCEDAFVAAEGAFLSVWFYDELKAEEHKKPPPSIQIFSTNQSEVAEWERGRLGAEGQNLARNLMETPANKMTPTIFTSIAQAKLSSLANVTVTPRDKAWAESKGMHAFLGVARGSAEPPVMLEVEYRGSDDPVVALVGKGITFDSGGISLKSPSNMDLMRADMGGAACVLGAIYAAAKLRLPVHVVGVMALTENMPGQMATKPGDVHKAMNGKTIQIDNTDAEGRLVLSDALHYTQITHNPSTIIDLATLTGAMMVAIGGSATGVFTNSNHVWNSMHQAGMKSGDRVWRMPLFKHYTTQIRESVLADVNNMPATKYGGSCTAAAFLKEFVTSEHWMHMDIAGVMKNENSVSYLPKGMSGRPVRTLVEFLGAYKHP